MRTLAPGERLLHIGPHKTGSTTLQGAFHGQREVLAAHGIHYAGRNRQPMTAAMVAASGRLLATKRDTAARSWDELVQEIDTAPQPRVVISSEFFCDADADHVKAILDRLGPDRTRVVVTLRPLTRILASQWQQYMQNRMVVPYDEWLDAVLNHPDQTSITPSFWRRHRHDRLVERWASCAGPDRVTVVVVDESDRLSLLRSFERLLSLDAGVLQPDESTANRSLSWPEVELVRTFNQQWRERHWSEADYTQFVRFAAVRHLQERAVPTREARVLTPRWAVDRAVEIASEMIAAVAASGVEVVGDLASLASGLPEATVGVNLPVDEVPTDAAARFCAGLIKRFAETPTRPAGPGRHTGDLENALRARGRDGRESTPPPQDPLPAAVVEDLPTRVLLQAVATRLTTRGGSQPVTVRRRRP